jgi:hypothetical protein
LKARGSFTALQILTERNRASSAVDHIPYQVTSDANRNEVTSFNFSVTLNIFQRVFETLGSVFQLKSGVWVLRARIFDSPYPSKK